MKIKKLHLFKIKIPLKNPVMHHLGSYRFSESIIVKVTTDKGIIGWGEARPRPYLTGETLESVRTTIADLCAKHLSGKVFANFEDVRKYLQQSIQVAKNMLSAYCGLELSILDAAGKEFRRNIIDIIGHVQNPIVTEAANIGFQIKTNELRKVCLAIKFGGYRAAKIKVGCQDDLERIRFIREFFGDRFFLWVDANGAWDFENALQKINQIKKYGVTVYEQPLAAIEMSNMARLRSQTKVKLIADESLCTMDDALALIKENACDIFNIRIGKCGGIQKSIDLINLANNNRIKFYLGSLVAETGILLQPLKLLVKGIKGVSIVEGLRQNNTLLEDDIVAGDAPYGLGIKISDKKLTKYSDNSFVCKIGVNLE